MALGSACGEVAEPAVRAGAPFGESLLGEPPANLIDLLVWLDAGSLADFGIGQTSRLGPNQRQHPFTIRHGASFAHIPRAEPDGSILP